MKTLRFVLLVLPLALLALTSQGVAGPATVVPLPACKFYWGGADVLGPHLLLLDATKGLLTITNNSRDNRAANCQGHVDFGAIVNAFVVDYGYVAPVQLLTIQQVCTAYPDACHGADDQGAVIFTPQSAGPDFACNVGPGADGTPVITHDVTLRITPGGQAELSCHWPE